MKQDFYNDTIPMLDELRELIALGADGYLTPWERNYVTRKHEVFHRCACRVEYGEYAKVKEIYKKAFEEEGEGDDE